MKLGRVVFGLSAVLFGVIGLMWHDEGTWQGMHAILGLPFGVLIGTLLMVAQIVGGIGLLMPRFARESSLVLCIVYGAFVLACVPGIVKDPKDFDGLFEQLALFGGAIVLFNAALARVALGLSAISFTATQYMYLTQTAGLVPKWIPPNQLFWAWATTALFALAAIAILLNVRAKMAMWLMGLMTGCFGIVVWIPILMAKPDSHFYWSEFAITMLITGATWTIAQTR